MQTALVIAFSRLAGDPRVDRQIRWLLPDYSVVAAGLGPPGVEVAEFVQLRWSQTAPAAESAPARLAGSVLRRIRNLPRRTRRVGRLIAGRVTPSRWRTRLYEDVYWDNPLTRDALSRLRHVRADVIVANDYDALPLALRLAAGRPVIFDAHEYAPREFDNDFWFRALQQPYRSAVCARYVPQAHSVTTVCRGIADALHADTGVRPVVVTNATAAERLVPQVLYGAAPIRMIHHGIAARVRRLDVMLQLMSCLDDRFELDLMLVPSSPGYVESLRRRASTNPRIRFRDPVPMRELARVSNEYDIGLFLLPPVNFNYLHALPNKFFEFVQARLAVAIGPSPEMAALVRRYRLGVVAEDFTPQALARELNALSHTDITRFKQNAHSAAAELNAEQNAVVFRGLVASALDG